MKTFRSLVQEAAKPKSRVILFGRMNPITKGHEENVQAAHDIAQNTVQICTSLPAIATMPRRIL